MAEHTEGVVQARFAMIVIIPTQIALEETKSHEHT